MIDRLQLGEVKSFIRLIQDQDEDTSSSRSRSTSTCQKDELQEKGVENTVARPPPGKQSVGVGEVLTLPALQAFMDGGDEYLSRREKELHERENCGRRMRDATLNSRHDSTFTSPDVTGSKLASEKQRSEVRLPRPRSSSWTDDQEGEGGAEGGVALDSKAPSQAQQLEHLCDSLRVLLSKVKDDSMTSSKNDDQDLRRKRDGVRGYLDSFDVGTEGRLSLKEFSGALGSLGASGKDFGGYKGLKALMKHIRGLNSDDECVSIRKVVEWCCHDTRTGTGTGTGTRTGTGTGTGTGTNTGLAGPPTTATTATTATRPGVAHMADIGGNNTETRSQLEQNRCERGDGSVQGGKGHGQRERACKPLRRRDDGRTLQRAIELAEGKGTTLERTFARLDEDGDGYITLRQLLHGLNRMGVFEHVSWRVQTSSALSGYQGPFLSFTVYPLPFRK